MKRWRKVLSGLLMAALIATGIALPEKTYAASEGMDGLKTVVNSGVGKMVDDKSTIDGSYDFAPIIGADTKITFGSTDGTMWDNTFCTKGQEHAKIITQWWPLADIGANGNTRSFTPYESLKGKMYAEYTNVGNANGLPVTMRIWFLDWQNTVISNGYKNEVGADIDAVIVAKDNTKGGATPVIDIKGLKWIKVKFAYYDPDGNPLNVKGHFTLTDLDYAQGFYIESGVDSIYVTKEADARLVYDPRTEAIWSAHKGSNSDDGTSPDNSEGWVTYTYEGDSQTMVFYNGGTIQNVDGPGQGLTTAQSYPKDFTFTGSDAKFNGWKGSSKTQSNDWHTWNTSEFGYTADMVMHQTKNVDLVIEKKDTTTAEALKGAEFTVYKLKSGQWEAYTKAVWDDAMKNYKALNLHAEDTENGKFKVVETKNPAGYIGSWEKEFTATDEGVVTLTLDVTNTRKTGQITITKTDENNKKLAGAVFDIKAAADIKSVGGTTLVVAGTVVDTVTTDANGTATSKELELGNYIVQETTAPAGYVLDTTEHNVTLDDSHTTVNVAVQNLKNRW